MLGLERTFSPRAIAAIEACEKKCGRKLPAAVREWYSIDGIAGVLDERSQENGSISLNHFIEMYERNYSIQDATIYFYGAWRANTGYEAMIVLDGSDDPPIDEGDPDAGRLRFSEFVQSTIWNNGLWDGLFAFTNDPQSDGHPFMISQCGPPQIDYLLESFDELPRTVDHTMTSTQLGAFDGWTFRLFRPQQCLELRTAGDPTSGLRPAHFHVAANSLSELLNLYESTWPMHGAALRLSGVPGIAFDDVKRRFRQRFPNVSLQDEPCRTR